MSRSRRVVAALATLAVAAGLAGCALPTGSGTAAPTAVPDPVTAAVAGPTPTTLDIPRLGIEGEPLVGLGLDPDMSIEEPPVTAPDVAGWYELGVHPGDPGPAVILGHVSGRPPGAPRPISGVFARLHTLRPGDTITVGRDRAEPARFVVYETTRAPKVAFPTERVYGNTAGPELRLITCGGDFDTSRRSYRDNWIVFARAA